MKGYSSTQFKHTTIGNTLAKSSGKTLLALIFQYRYDSSMVENETQQHDRTHLATSQTFV